METLQRTANRGSISTGYDIDNSCKFEADNSEGMWFAPSSTTNDTTWTFSCWFKQTELASVVNSIFGHYTDANNQALYRIDSDNKLELRLVNGGTIRELHTDMLFRDNSAWYHLVIAVDTTDGTTANRVKVYVNGSQVDLTGTYPTSSLATYGINTNAKNMDIGIFNSGSGTAYSFNGYLAEIHHIDGSQLAPTEFGETDSDTGIWKPIEYTGTYGTNGFYLDFEDSSSLGADDSGNSNNFTLNNITSVDQATDTPTNNFCIQSSIISFTAREPATTFAINGGTSSSDSSSNSWRGVMCTIGVTAGKWYWEVKYNDVDDQRAGVHTFTGAVGSNTNPQNIDNSWGLYGGDGSGCYWTKQIDGTSTSNSANRGNVISGGDIIGVALDLENDELSFYINGSSGGTHVSNIDISTLTAAGNPLIPFIAMYRGSMPTNFGGRSGFTISSGNADANGYGNFEYAPPSGYYALCSKNLAEFGG